MERICVLLNGGIKYDQRVIKTIRTLSKKYYIDYSNMITSNFITT